MASKGLTIPIWIGWMCGVVVLRRPWGSPALPSWLTFSTFYCVFGLAMYCFLMSDFLVNNSDTLGLGEEHKFGKYVRSFALLQYGVITFFKRINFLTSAKQLASLLGILNEYEKRRQHSTGAYNWGYKKRKILLPILIYSSFVITFIFLITKGITFLLHTADKPSWVKLLGVGAWGYTIFYWAFVIIPLGIVSNVAYATIIVTSLQICRMFCDMCDGLTKSMSALVMSGDIIHRRQRHDDLEIYSILKLRSKEDWDREDKIKESGIGAVGGRNKVASVSPVKREHVGNVVSRQDITTQFEELKTVMRLADDALSGLILWMVCGMTLGIVANASQIFVTGQRNTGMHLVSDCFTIVVLMLYCMLLEFGHRIKRMQRAAKLKLHKQFLNLPWSMEKEEMEDVIQEIMDFEWKLSACGFFTVDRGLASGIFSLVLNYVVILVQLNIALLEKPQSVCSNNETNAGNFTWSEITP